MIKNVRTGIAIMITAVAFCGLLLVDGCEGSKSKKDITRTVEQAVGAETAKKGRQMEQDVKQSMQQEMERAKQDINAGVESGEGVAPKESPETE